ncbi:MAG: PilZ domain-containing protein [Methylococcales bacterium]|nr:PilZ domain-containing protein [Methylococcales bacterium]
MENMAEFNSDRRDFFRITDYVYINVSTLNNDEIEDLIPIINSHNLGHDDDDAQHHLALQTNINHLIDQINQTDRDVARVLRLLDEKISAISSSFKKKEQKEDDRKATKVNLSGGGIAFLTVDQYEPGTAVEIYLELQSSSTIIHSIAHIIACNEAYDAPKETPYLLRLSFTHMSEVNQNLLVKHTLAQQALELRTKN